jgi:hypothetical protein
MDIIAACHELASTGFGDTLTVGAIGAALVLAGAGVIAVRSKNKALVLLLVVGLTTAAVVTSPSTTDVAVASCPSDNGDSGSGGTDPDPDPDDGGGGTDPDPDGGGGGTDPDPDGGGGDGTIDGGDGGVIVSNARNNGSWGENYHPTYCVGFQTPMVQIGNANMGDYVVFDPGTIPGAISDYVWTIDGVEANSWGPGGSQFYVVWHDETLVSAGETKTIVVTDGVTTYRFNATFN